MRRLRAPAAAAGEISQSESVPCFGPDSMANIMVGSAYASLTSSHGAIRRGDFFLTTTIRVGGRREMQPFAVSSFLICRIGTCTRAPAARDLIFWGHVRNCHDELKMLRLEDYGGLLWAKENRGCCALLGIRILSHSTSFSAFASPSLTKRRESVV
jgi:hypothetical protein